MRGQCKGQSHRGEMAKGVEAGVIHFVMEEGATNQGM